MYNRLTSLAHSKVVPITTMLIFILFFVYAKADAKRLLCVDVELL